MKVIEQYFHVLLFTVLYKVVLNFESVDETLVCDHWNVSYWYEQYFHMVVYTCQLSRLRRESHAWGLKTSISRRLTLAGQSLTPDWKMWVVAVLLDTIAKNMWTQTHVRNENHVKDEQMTIPSSRSPIFEVESTRSELTFTRVLRLGLGKCEGCFRFSSQTDVFGRLPTSSEDFGLLREYSEMIVSFSKIPALPG